MDPDTLKQFAEMGIGVVIAGIVLFWKRGDDVKYQSALTDVIGDCNKREEQMLTALQANTGAMQALKTVIEQMSSLRELEKQVGELTQKLRTQERDN